MIISKQSTIENIKNVITRSDKPNENWTNDTDVFIVDDNSDLGKKIISIMPYFNFVLDSQGNLTDITSTQKTSEPQTPSLQDQILAINSALDYLLGLGVS